MNVLVLGSGGREHAISWKIAQSSQIDKLFIAPGNAGTSQVGTNIELPLDDFQKIADFCLKEKVDYIVVGCGLAGLSFCEKLLENNKSFIVIDNNSQQSSVVAGGLYNPVTLKRFTPVWKSEESSSRTTSAIA